MAMDYPTTDLPAAGSAYEIAPGVRWLRMPLPFALDHINLWLLADGQAWTAVDTGLSSSLIRDAWEQLLPRYPLVRQIVTHFHPDHLGLAAWLQEKTGAELWMTESEYAVGQLIAEQIAGWSIPSMLAFFRAHGLDEARCQALEDRGNAYRRGVPAIPPTFRRLLDGDLIDIGEHQWQVIVGYGHAPEHASLYCASKGVLISGDMLLPRISTNISSFAAMPDSDPLGSFLASLQRLTELPADTLVLPSHGLPFRGIHERVAELSEHHRQRCDELLAACAGQALSAAELIPVLFSREIPDAHQAMFAMGEAIAHLVYLEHRGKLQRQIEDGVHRFSSVN
jgi:glyoxylase-like metal-dependent hydrolase (beta-lactamase superfamily II)